MMPAEFDITGKVVFLTGAGRGIGKGIAQVLAEAGADVALNALTPGDLLFMYQPIGHVTIYIGDGLMVSAPTEGEPVSIVPVSAYLSDTVGATHLG